LYVADDEINIPVVFVVFCDTRERQSKHTHHSSQHSMAAGCLTGHVGMPQLAGYTGVENAWMWHKMRNLSSMGVTFFGKIWHNSHLV